MPTAVKLSDELVESARTESSVWSRSMTQQIEHWARIGRSLERSGSVEMKRVRAALSAQVPFDELSSEERVVVLGELERAIFRPDGNAELAAKLRERGTPLSGIDPSGRLASFLPDGRVVPMPAKTPKASVKKTPKKTPAASTGKAPATSAKKQNRLQAARSGLKLQAH